MLLIRSLKGRRPRSAIRDRCGLAMIEFALAMPLLLTVGLAGAEVAHLALVTLRINQLAMMAADNAARVRHAMDESDINEVMAGMRFAGSGIGFAERGRVILSDIESNDLPLTDLNAGYQIVWQRCFGAKNLASAFGAEGVGQRTNVLRYGISPTGPARVPGGMIPVLDSGLIVAEVRYIYTPLVAAGIFGTRELRAVQSFPVRDRARQALGNATNLTTATKRLCDAAHLGIG